MSKDDRLFYLAGGMEFSPDGPVWRKRASDVLRGKNIKIFNPYEEEPRLFESGPVYQLIYKLDKEKDFDKYREIMSQIIKYDLGRVANDVSGILVKVDQGVLRGAGTYAEISLAHYLGKPVHSWIHELTLRDVPAWALGCFSTVSYTLEDALDKIINGE